MPLGFHKSICDEANEYAPLNSPLPKSTCPLPSKGLLDNPDGKIVGFSNQLIRDVMAKNFFKPGKRFSADRDSVTFVRSSRI